MKRKTVITTLFIHTVKTVILSSLVYCIVHIYI